MLRVLLACAVVAGAAPLCAADNRQVPMIGRDGPGLDACGGIGRVTGLNPLGENFLAVRERPAPRAREIDRLGPATLVWLCEGAGDWQGIVYADPAIQDLGDCRVSSPVAQPRAYDGPCKAGWVAAKYLQLVAG